MSTHNLCFEQKYEKYQFLTENVQFLVKFAIYLNRHVFIMCRLQQIIEINWSEIISVVLDKVRKLYKSENFDQKRELT